MINRNKLNRIQGVLSARLGAEIPKFQGGAKFTRYKGTLVIYSNDNVTWYSDPDLAIQFDGDVNEFKDMNNPVPDEPIAPTSPNDSPRITMPSPAAIPDKLILSEDIKLQIKTSLDKLYKQYLKEKRREIRREKIENFTQKAAPVVTLAFLGIGDAFGAAQAVTDSSTTKTADALYDLTSEIVKKMGPVGLVVGTAMGFAGTAGDIIQGLGGGTDQMTGTDKWMDSSFFSWNVGMINGFGGKKSDAFAADQDILASVGSSYGGTTEDINNATAKASKKYGLFSSGARRKANRQIAAAKAKLNLMGDISEEATDLRLNAQSMGELAGLAYSLMTDGGYNQKYTYAAKHGGLLEWNPIIELEWEPQIELNWELPEFKEGGSVDLVEELKLSPKFLNGGKTRTLKELIEYAKKENPRFIQRLSEPPHGIEFIDDEGNKGIGNVYLMWGTDDAGNAVIYPRILEMEDKSLKFLSNDEAWKRANKNNNILIMSPEEAQIFFAEDPEYQTAYKRGWPEMFKNYSEKVKSSTKELKEGGTLKEELKTPETEETTLKNVIPEGALHKNKHHMEHAEGLTKKGIPVIDEDGEQQAEIEHSEIIFTLEVTKKLEEYYDIFYSDESSNKEKEQAALDAGKLLVYQILENTEDRTGLIESCKKGGSLKLKTSTDDLIKEVLEWMPTIVVIEEEEIKEEKPKGDKKKSEKELMKEAIKEVLIELLTK